jgi:membrane protein
MSTDRPSVAALVYEAFQRLFADEAIPLAGNIAFRTLFSIFPFLIFLTALAGFFGNTDLADTVVVYLLSVAPERIVHPITPEIRSILTVPRTGLLSLSAIITIWSAMAGVDSIRVGLNRAYDLKETRSFWMLYLQSVLFIIGAAAVLLAFSLLIVFGPVILITIQTYAPGIRGSFDAIDRWRFPIAILLLTGWLLICHRLLPAKSLTIREVLPGVLLTVIVWIVLSSAYSIYLVRFGNFASTYASLSGLFAAMFFLYLAALVLIFGGEVNRVIAIHGARDKIPEPPNSSDRPAS